MQKYLFLTLLCLISVAGMGQQADSSRSSKKQMADSISQAKLQNFKYQGDSLTQSGSRKLNAIADNNKAKLEAGKGKLKSTVDSSARAKAKNDAKQAVNKQLSPFAESGKSFKARLKKPSLPVKTGTPLLKLSGEVRSESYAATAQNPVMRNEPVYSRLYISPTVTVLGLPFKATMFLTTESNNTWKSNFFSIRFDANAMRQQAAADIQKQLDEAKRLDRIRQFDLQKNALETSRYEQELQRMKGLVPDADSLQAAIVRQAEAKSRQYLEQQKVAAEERMKKAGEDEKKRIEAELKQQQDSIINHYKQQAGDSLMQTRSKYTGPADTAKLGHYLRMQQQLDRLKAGKQKLEALRQADSAKLLQKASTIRNPDDLRKMAKSQLPGKGLLGKVLAVDRFGIGLVSPQYSEFTLYSASVKGLDIGVNRDKWFYDLTIGRSTKQLAGIFSDQRPRYDRNMAIARVGLGELKGNHIAAEYFYAYDPASDNKAVPMIRNGVLNISARFELMKRTLVEAEAAQSSYSETYAERQTAVQYNQNSAVLPGISVNKAYRIKATHAINENTKIESSFKQTGAGFHTLGNPFLRRNFREGELRYEQAFWKKQIKVSAFYKEMRDNLAEVNTSTNRMKGYGLKLNTAFDKYPNLTLSYSPYQQGNNHPDSLYRTNNQFSVTNAMLTYKRRFKSVNWNGILSYTRSAMELNQRGNVAYTLMNTVHTFQVGSRHTSVLSYMRNTTAPFVDSLNSRSVQLSHNYLAKKNLSTGLLAEHTQFKNGAYKTGAGVQVTSVIIKNFTLSLMTRYDRIYKLWNIPSSDVFTARLILMYRF